MPKIDRFEDIDGWKKARELVKAIYEATFDRGLHALPCPVRAPRSKIQVDFQKGKLGTRNSELGTSFVSWVMGFGKHAEVLEPAHLRQAVAEELATTAGIYGEKREPVYEGDSQRGTS